MFQSTPIEGLLVFKPKLFSDSRGFFVESFNQKVFAEAGIKTQWVQDNFSQSHKNVLRGLHMQSSPHEQAKLVSVVKGSAWDVAVDLRPNSKTFGQWYGIELSENNIQSMYIPRGFAHGFVALSETTHFYYKVDQFYNPQSDTGIHFADHDLDIRWPIDTKNLIISPKDSDLPSLADFNKKVLGR